MADETDIPAGSIAVDEAIRDWRQGDCVVGKHWFVFQDVSAPAESAEEPIGADPTNKEDPVEGFVVATQSCDIERTCAERPFVEVHPLVLIELAQLGGVKRAQRPRYAFVPALEEQRLVADLDRVMAITKALLATWERVEGCRSDQESRAFADALARKRRRFAFPDDFTRLVEPLRERLEEKHGKQSPEGTALRALREIRVAASPSWDAEQVTLIFWFVLGDGGAEVKDEVDAPATSVH